MFSENTFAKSVYNDMQHRVFGGSSIHEEAIDYKQLIQFQEVISDVCLAKYLDVICGTLH